MGTATIIGTVYNTVKLADGKEWMASRLDYAPLTEYGGYNAANVATIAALLSDGWRFPTVSDANGLLALVPNPTELDKIRTTVGWTTTNGTNEWGLSLYPGGWLESGVLWHLTGQSSFFWIGNATKVVHVTNTALTIENASDYGGDLTTRKFTIRLVRDVPFHGFSGMDFGTGPEWGYEPKITPSLTWTKTASGLWRCLDDGAAFDAYYAEITVKVSGAVHSAWETFIAANRGAQVTYFAPAGVRPFGPHIDCTNGVQVVIGDGWSTDWRVGVTANCYTLHIPMRYVGGYTPTLATIPAVVARKYPTPTWFYPTKVHATEAGTATAAPRDTETQTTQIIIDNLDPTAAAEMVNWCLYQRGASFTYTPTANAFPFGVAVGNGPFTARLIGWTCQKPRPNRWDMTLDLARES